QDVPASLAKPPPRLLRTAVRASVGCSARTACARDEAGRTTLVVVPQPLLVGRRTAQGKRGGASRAALRPREREQPTHLEPGPGITRGGGLVAGWRALRRLRIDRRRALRHHHRERQYRTGDGAQHRVALPGLLRSARPQRIAHESPARA